MKLKVLVLLLLISQSALSTGPIRNAGVKLGYASSTWTKFFSYEITRHGGLDIGAFVEWFDITAFSLITEVHYVKKGAEFVDETPFGENGSPRADYLSFLLLAKGRLLNQGVSPYLFAGPRMDLLLRFREMGTVPESGGEQNLILAATVGIGIEMKAFDFVQLGIEFRYSPDITDSYSSLTRNNSMEFLIVAGF